MKTKQKFAKIISLTFLILTFFFYGEICWGAENVKPADCVNLNNPYTRAPDNVEYYSFAIPDTEIGYLPYFRAFIPPGTIAIDLLIIEGGDQMAVARHKKPPKGLPQSPPSGYTPVNEFSLQELVDDDQWVTESLQGYLYITHDSLYPPATIFDAGWLYAKVGGGQYSSVYFTTFSVKVDTKTYNQWWDTYIKDQAGWDKYIESVETYIDPTSEDPNPPTTPSGPGCEAKTCQKVSCHNGTNWSPGTKTQDCATGTAEANPTRVKLTAIKNQPTAEETTYLTWTAKEAKTLKVTCSGSATMVIRGDIELTSDLWMTKNQASYLKPAGAPDGAPGYFNPDQSGTEICTFYPINSSDGQSGTPFSLEIRVLGAVSCGNNIKEEDEECDYNLTQGQISGIPCPQGKTCEKCQCVTLTNSSYICEPDDPACAKSTCQDVSCFDGCNYHQGEKSCVGRR